LGLLEVGPQQDRSILSRSDADIAGAAYAVMAIRINPIRMAVDLRAEVPAHIYRSYQLQRLLDDLSEHTEITQRSLVRLSSGTYVMLMVPATSD
jgi:hypothetical protein